jgi:hypothetical protein
MTTLPTIIIVSPNAVAQRVPLYGRLSVGRVPGNNLVLDGPKVSREHLWIEHQAAGVMIWDRRSTNGTWLNRQRVAPDTWHPWGTGIPLQLDTFTLWLELSPDHADDPDTRFARPGAARAERADHVPVAVGGDGGAAAATPRGELWEFFDAVASLSEKWHSVRCFFYIMGGPLDHSMRLIEGAPKYQLTESEQRYNPYKFMAFGLAASAIIGGATGETSFLAEALESLLSAVYLVITLLVSFYVTRWLSRADRDLRRFLRLVAVQTGVYGMIYIVASVIASIPFVPLDLALLVSGIYLALFVWNWRLYRRFWELPYWRIFVYNLLSALATGAVFFALGMLLVWLLGG